MAIFSDPRARVELGITVAGEALKTEVSDRGPGTGGVRSYLVVVRSVTGLAGVVAGEAGGATVGHSLQHEQVLDQAERE